MPPTFDDSLLPAADVLIRLALDEDLRDRGDVTTLALVGPEERGAVEIVARAAGVLSGMPVARRVFATLDPRVQLRELRGDGAPVVKGSIVAEVVGPLRSLLIGERSALNFLTHLSGIASLTRRYVEAVAGTRARVYDTRKTHPGFRALEKYAVRCGGGANHRHGLYDMVLIKDNHRAGWLAAKPGRTLADAVRAARAQAPAGTPIQIEVDSLDQLRDALAGQPDMVLLDNMPVEQLREAVAVRDANSPQVELEASGGVTLATIGEIARTGVERISAGALTHSAVALDLAFDWKT